MPIEDQDFIIRQIQQLAQGLGKFLGVKSIKEILQFEQTEEGQIADEDIEAILLITNIEEIQENKDVKIEEIAQELSIEVKNLKELFVHERFPTESELEKLRTFVENNQNWLD